MNEKTQKILNYLGIFIFVTIVIFTFSVFYYQKIEREIYNIKSSINPTTTSLVNISHNFQNPLSFPPSPLEQENILEASPSQIEEILSLIEKELNKIKNTTSLENFPISPLPTLPKLPKIK